MPRYLLFVSHVKGVHTNMNVQMNLKTTLYPMVAQLWPSVLMPDKRDQDLLLPVGEKLIIMLQETGYMHIQATKPQTVGGYLSRSIDENLTCMEMSH